MRDETSATNAKTVRSVLRGFCGYAVIHGAITVNPVADAIRLESTREPERALTSGQVFDLLAKLDASDHAEKHDLPDFIRLCVATGERVGEFLGARWVDFDEDERLLTMGRSVVRTSEGLIVREGKTERSQRDIPLPEWCTNMLMERRAKMSPENDESPIFPSSTGTIREPSNIYNRAWGPFREQAGYQWVTFHTFRRTVATFLDDANLTARQIADVLGHAHPSMTQDVYMARYTPGRASADALDAVWRKRKASVGQT